MVFALAAVAGAAWAAPTVRFGDTPSGDTVNVNDGHRADLGANGSWDFVTFCVEVQEPLAYGTTYEYGVSKEIKNRGGQGSLSLDNAVGHAIAHIFQSFVSGGEQAIADLSGIDGFSASQYRELAQRTFWNKLYGGFTTADITQAHIDQLWAAAFGRSNGLGNVRVMNVWVDADTQSDGRQDMLIIIPLPSSAGLASVGLLGAVAAVRRRR
jgi:hypothetical protein